MTATTVNYVSEQPNGSLAALVDTIRFAMKLKDEFEKMDDPEARHEAVCKLLSSNWATNTEVVGDTKLPTTSFNSVFWGDPTIFEALGWFQLIEPIETH